MSRCTAWVGDKYIGEVISPFRTLQRQKMVEQFPFFQSLPQKKADFVKKKPIGIGVLVQCAWWGTFIAWNCSSKWVERGGNKARGLKKLLAIAAWGKRQLHNHQEKVSPAAAETFEQSINHSAGKMTTRIPQRSQMWPACICKLQ